MLNLSTILQCKCIFSPKKFVILNKTTIFAVCYYKTQCNISITTKTFAIMATTIEDLKNQIMERAKCNNRQDKATHQSTIHIERGYSGTQHHCV